MLWKKDFDQFHKPSISFCLGVAGATPRGTQELQDAYMGTHGASNREAHQGRSNKKECCNILGAL